MNRLREAASIHIARLGWRRILFDYAQITIGTLLLALAYNLMFVPNNIVSGGISGLAVILHHLLGWRVGLVILVFNVPLFLAGLRWGGGLTTGIRTIYAVLVMSLAIDLTATYLPAVTDNPLLFVTYGGLLDGLGLGLVLRAQGTTGGTDIIARLLRCFTGLEISRGAFIANALIIGAAALVFGLEQAMYGVMVAAISSAVLETVLAGGRRARQAFIITDKSDEVRQAVLNDLERGLTILPGRGAYTGKDRPILMCVIAPREVPRLRRTVELIDPDAFVIVGMATEVYGEGFQAIDSDL